MFPYYRSASSWIGLGPWSYAHPMSPWTPGDFLVGAEETQSQDLGYTPPSNVQTPDVPSPAKTLFNKLAAEESARRKRALDLEAVKRWAEAAAFWRLAASDADEEAAIAHDRPDLNLEAGVKIGGTAAVRAMGYRALATKDDALAAGAISLGHALPQGGAKPVFGADGTYLGPEPAVPDDPIAKVPLWAWLVGAGALVYVLMRYIR